MAASSDSPGGGTKAIAYIASFFIPLVGVILFFLWRTNPSAEYRTLGRNALIVSIAVVVVGCLLQIILGGVIGATAGA